MAGFIMQRSASSNSTLYSNCKTCRKFLLNGEKFCSDECQKLYMVCPACLKVFIAQDIKQSSCSQKCYISNAHWYL